MEISISFLTWNGTVEEPFDRLASRTALRPARSKVRSSLGEPGFHGFYATPLRNLPTDRYVSLRNSEIEAGMRALVTLNGFFNPNAWLPSFFPLFSRRADYEILPRFSSLASPRASKRSVYHFHPDEKRYQFRQQRHLHRFPGPSVKGKGIFLQTRKNRESSIGWTNFGNAVEIEEKSRSFRSGSSRHLRVRIAVTRYRGK